MNPTDPKNMHRRAFLGAALSLPAALAIGCGRGRQDRGFDAAVPRRRPGAPTPVAPAVPGTAAAVDATCLRTEDNIEGPFFKAGAPWRANFAPKGTPGQPFSVAGRVLGTDCKPLRGAKLEFWQANHAGEYDNKGTDFRGTLAADPTGRFRLDTIVPGRYLNGETYRPAHIHVKLSAQGYAPLTTQLYFPGDPYNAKDPWIRSSLIMKVRQRKTRMHGAFDFVLVRG